MDRPVTPVPPLPSQPSNNMDQPVTLVSSSPSPLSNNMDRPVTPVPLLALPIRNMDWPATPVPAIPSPLTNNMGRLAIPVPSIPSHQTNNMDQPVTLVSSSSSHLLHNKERPATPAPSIFSGLTVPIGAPLTIYSTFITQWVQSHRLRKEAATQIDQPQSDPHPSATQPCESLQMASHHQKPTISGNSLFQPTSPVSSYQPLLNAKIKPGSSHNPPAVRKAIDNRLIPPAQSQSTSRLPVKMDLIQQSAAPYPGLKPRWSTKTSRSPTTPGNPCDSSGTLLALWSGAAAMTPLTYPILSSSSENSSDDELNYKKLKGAKFPGMGMLDAANPDDRKKRNQRKDGSVVEKMKKSSEQVHAPAQLDDLVGRQDQLEATSLRRWFGLKVSSVDVFSLGSNNSQKRRLEAEQIAAEAKHIYRTPSVNGSEDEDEDEINA